MRFSAFALLMLAAAPAMAQPSVEFRRAILFSALGERQVYSQQGLNVCYKRTHDPVVYQATVDLWNQREALSDNEPLLKRLSLQGEIERIRYFCKKELSAYEGKLEEKQRAPFKTIYGILSVVPGFTPALAVMAELDPACTTAFGADQTTREIETNTCIAGHQILFSKISKMGFQQEISDSTAFIWEFHRQLEASKAGDSIDYWKIYRKIGKSNAMDFFSMLTALHTIAASGQGYVDKFEERVIQNSLTTERSAPRALKLFEDFVDRRDRMPQYRNGAAKKGVKLLINGVPFDGYNHHDIISAFLTCHYRETGRSALGHTLPKALGIAYEAKDFVANVGSGWNIGEALKKFERNVKRYQRGRDVAEGLCPAN